MPTTSENPFTGAGFLRRITNHLDDVGPALGVGELEVARRFADAGEMHVRIDETGGRQPALEIDHARVRTDQWLHVLVRSNRDNGVAVHRQRLRLWACVVDRHNSAATQNKVRGSRRGARLRERRHNLRRRRAQYCDRGNENATNHDRPPMGIVVEFDLSGLQRNSWVS